MPDGVVLDPAYLAEVRARCEAIRSRTFDGPVARAMDDTARLLAAAEGYAAAVAEVQRLRGALESIKSIAWGTDAVIDGDRAAIVSRCVWGLEGRLL